MRRALARLLLPLLVVALQGARTGGGEADADGVAPPPRTKLSEDAPEVRDALRFVMTELRRLSNRFRYSTLVETHGAASGPANFDGTNLFLDLEFDMLRGQRSRHEVIVFRDETGTITGMAIDEFPEVELRERPDPDV